ncbi:probable chitinase 10 [Scaptodrosophila lebanonensis]|uniref:Probable chitinase 10 n=1 Tax=Drosophila lebanonensis TaxID=7225 RepID=A0A6J2TK00_DROLE|nr:probable chitinase 10 [Scaptodrosophila lebanonensis]
MASLLSFMLWGLTGVLAIHSFSVDIMVSSENEKDEETSFIMGEVNLCSNVANNVFLPYVGNCSKYYLCMYGQATEHPCGAIDSTHLLRFDARTQSCTDDEDIKCLPECKSSVLSSFCYDRTCSKYVLCYNNQAVLRQCQDGLQYNAETDRCDFPQFVDCVDNLCSPVNNPNDITYIPSKAQCDKYYVCVNAIPHSQLCAGGLQFNPKCNCCDFPSNAECTITALQRNIKPYSRAPPRRADITCPEKGVHFFAHQTRKDAYYYCLDGQGLTLDCTPGLLYDSNVHECREPKNIKF